MALIEVHKMKCFITNLVKHFWKNCRQTSSLANATLDQDVKEKIGSREMKARKHLGSCSKTPIQLPNQLVDAIEKIIAPHYPKNLHREALSFCRHLCQRRQPAEDDRLRIVSDDLSIRLQYERGDVNALPEDSQEIEMDKRRRIVKKAMQSAIYNWKPIDYTQYNSLLYLVGRMAPDYAVMTKLFTELRKIDPDFVPTTLFDFGSGVGSVIWSARSLWGDVFKEYFCIDTSDEMNDLSKSLLQDGIMTRTAPIKGLFYRQFLPASDLIKYDLVVSAYSLLELPSIELRLQTLDNLWRKTKDYMVIVEYGTLDGFKTIMEARDFLLKSSEEDSAITKPAIHIVAPCPHDKPCPLELSHDKKKCSFGVSYHPLSFYKTIPQINEYFCYVILKKSRRTSVPWPRFIQRVTKSSKQVACTLCTGEGKLEECHLTKGNSDRLLYKIIRRSSLGDQLPVNFDESSSKLLLNEGNSTTTFNFKDEELN